MSSFEELQIPNRYDFTKSTWGCIFLLQEYAVCLENWGAQILYVEIA